MENSTMPIVEHLPNGTSLSNTKEKSFVETINQPDKDRSGVPFDPKSLNYKNTPVLVIGLTEDQKEQIIQSNIWKDSSTRKVAMPELTKEQLLSIPDKIDSTILSYQDKFTLLQGSPIGDLEKGGTYTLSDDKTKIERFRIENTDTSTKLIHSNVYEKDVVFDPARIVPIIPTEIAQSPSTDKPIIPQRIIDTPVPKEPQNLSEEKQPGKIAYQPNEPTSIVKETDPKNIYKGILVDHGAAPFDFDPENKINYYVKLEQAPGKEKVLWGVDLERAIKESDTKFGEKINIQFEGFKPVQVEANVKDESGQVIGTENKTVMRNTWNAKTITEEENLKQSPIIPTATPTKAIFTTNEAGEIHNIGLDDKGQLVAKPINKNSLKESLQNILTLADLKLRTGQNMVDSFFKSFVASFKSNTEKNETILAVDKKDVPVALETLKDFGNQTKNVISQELDKAGVNHSIESYTAEMKEKKTLFKAEDINWPNLEKLGINRSSLENSDDLQRLLRGERSNILQLKGFIGEVPMDGSAKLRLIADENGKPKVVIHGVSTELRIPEELNGHKFTEKQKEELVKNNRIKEPVLLKDNTGAKQEYYIGVDTELKKVVAISKATILKANVLKEVYGEKLTSEQQNKVLVGDVVQIGKNESGPKIAANIDFSKNSITVFKPVIEQSMKVDEKINKDETIKQDTKGEAKKPETKNVVKHKLK